LSRYKSASRSAAVEHQQEERSRGTLSSYKRTRRSAAVEQEFSRRKVAEGR